MVALAEGIYIEPGIRSLVDAVNSWEESETVSSCEGHRWQKKPPFVYLRPTSIDALSAVGRIAVFIQIVLAPELNYFWDIRGTFPFPDDIYFAIWSPALDCKSWWSTRKVNEDTSRIAKEIRPESFYSTSTREKLAQALQELRLSPPYGGRERWLGILCRSPGISPRQKPRGNTRIRDSV